MNELINFCIKNNITLRVTPTENFVEFEFRRSSENELRINRVFITKLLLVLEIKQLLITAKSVL